MKKVKWCLAPLKQKLPKKEKSPAKKLPGFFILFEQGGMG